MSEFRHMTIRTSFFSTRLFKSLQDWIVQTLMIMVEIVYSFAYRYIYTSLSVDPM